MIKRELAIFVIVGFITVIVDFSVYRTVYYFSSISIEAAKTAGFVIGTIFAYFANRLGTFKHIDYSRGTALRFTLLYTSTLTVNAMINTITLNAFANKFAAIEMSFLVATAFSSVVNFIGMKYFVFRRRAPV